MKKALLASALVLAVASPAFAQSVSTNAGVMGNQSTDGSVTVGPRTGSAFVSAQGTQGVNVQSNAQANGAGLFGLGTPKASSSVITQANAQNSAQGNTTGRNATGFADVNQGVSYSGHARAR